MDDYPKYLSLTRVSRVVASCVILCFIFICIQCMRLMMEACLTHMVGDLIILSLSLVQTSHHVFCISSCTLLILILLANGSTPLKAELYTCGCGLVGSRGAKIYLISTLLLSLIRIRRESLVQNIQLNTRIRVVMCQSVTMWFSDKMHT